MWCDADMYRLLNVLEVIAPFKQFTKLREFLQQRLPPGFPVKIGTIFYILHDTDTFDLYFTG